MAVECRARNRITVHASGLVRHSGGDARLHALRTGQHHGGSAQRSAPYRADRQHRHGFDFRTHDAQQRATADDRAAAAVCAHPPSRSGRPARLRHDHARPQSRAAVPQKPLSRRRSDRRYRPAQRRRDIAHSRRVVGSGARDGHDRPDALPE